MKNSIKAFMKKKDIDVEENYTVYKYRMLNVAPINFDWQIKRYTKKLERAYKDYIKQEMKESATNE